MLKTIISFLLMVFVSSAHAGEHAIEQLERFLDSTQSMSARFEQTLIDQYGQRLQESAGQLSLQRPGKFRWDYTLPYPQNIISNGRKIWMYDSELEQVNIRPYDQLLASSPVKLLDNHKKLSEEFYVEAMPDAEGLQWVMLRPKQKESDFTQMLIGMKDGKIVSMRFMDNFNQRTAIEFKQLLLNPSFDSEHFEFKAPPGTDVVGDF